MLSGMGMGGSSPIPGPDKALSPCQGQPGPYHVQNKCFQAWL